MCLFFFLSHFKPLNQEIGHVCTGFGCSYVYCVYLCNFLPNPAFQQSTRIEIVLDISISIFDIRLPSMNQCNRLNIFYYYFIFSFPFHTHTHTHVGKRDRGTQRARETHPLSLCIYILMDLMKIADDKKYSL